MKTPTALIAMLWITGLALDVRAAPASPAVEAQVVSLDVTFQAFNEDSPWARQVPATRTAMAVVVDGSHLLTTADIVQNATLIRVRRHDSEVPAVARVAHVDFEVNLALLAIDDPVFQAALAPVRFAAQAPAEGVLSTVRWRDHQLEAASTRVARVEVGASETGFVEHAFLMATTDISGGGWAEPVFLDGVLVGIVSLQDKQNVSIIPAEILKEYVAQARVASGYVGFAGWGVAVQFNDDPTLAAYLGATGEPTGLLIRQVSWGSTGCGVLKPRDILVAMDGHDIDARGFYRHPRYGRLDFKHILVDGHRPGDHVKARVWRERRLVDVDVALRPYPVASTLIPTSRRVDPPPYVIAGGLVFRELDIPYLRTWGDKWRRKAPVRLVTAFDLSSAAQSPERRRVVILQNVLAAPFNLGYHDLGNLIVERVNGRPVGSLADLAGALANPVDGFQRIVFEANEIVSHVVLDAATLEAATNEIIANYRIPEAVRLSGTPAVDPGPPCPGN